MGRFVLIFAIFVVTSLEAKLVEAKSRVCETLLSGLVSLSAYSLTPQSDASILHTRQDLISQEIWNSRLPYKTFTNGPEQIQITDDTELKNTIIQMHSDYQNRVWEDRPQSYIEPEGLWRADDFRPNNIGPIWLQADGQCNSLKVVGKFEAPLGHFMGIETIYDATPHTPGLYQFTVISYSGYPFYATVTHYAWLVNPSLQNTLSYSADHYDTRNSVQTIPTRGTMTLAAIAISHFFGRRRMR